jgi:hypothetical protein
MDSILRRRGTLGLAFAGNDEAGCASLRLLFASTVDTRLIAELTTLPGMAISKRFRPHRGDGSATNGTRFISVESVNNACSDLNPLFGWATSANARRLV